MPAFRTRPEVEVEVEVGFGSESSLARPAPRLPEAERAHRLRDAVVERLRGAARAGVRQRVLDLLHADARAAAEPRIQVVRRLLICSSSKGKRER